MDVPRSVSDCATIEQLTQMFAHKTAKLERAIELKPLSYNACQCLRALEEGMKEVQVLISQLEDELRKGEENLRKMKALDSRLSSIHTNVDHALQNLPEALLKKNTTVQKSENGYQNKEKPTNMAKAQSCKKVGSKVPSVVPLSLSEFEAVPKYMKGRITYESINSFIQDFNKTIAAKYQFLATPRSQLGNNGYKVVQEMRSQETAETKGHCFCIMQDLKKFGNIKSENSTKAMLTILRHCCRTKEIRGPGPILRFVVVDS